MHTVANPDKGVFGDSKQSFVIRVDATSQLNAFPLIYAYRVYRKAPAGDLSALQSTLPQTAPRRYAKSNARADALRVSQHQPKRQRQGFDLLSTVRKPRWAAERSLSWGCRA